MSLARNGQGEPPAVTEMTERRQQPLRNCVRSALERYFADLDGHRPRDDLYHFVLAEVELPLLQTVMHQVHGNQSRAAGILGITRVTLRKKLQQYGLL